MSFSIWQQVDICKNKQSLGKIDHSVLNNRSAKSKEKQSSSIQNAKKKIPPEYLLALEILKSNDVGSIENYSLYATRNVIICWILKFVLVWEKFITLPLKYNLLHDTNHLLQASKCLTVAPWKYSEFLRLEYFVSKLDSWKWTQLFVC